MKVLQQSKLCGRGAGRSTIRPTTRGATVRAVSATSTQVEIPQSCRNISTVLKGKNGEEIYLLGVSHISKVDLGKIREFISAVKPDAVLVELCKDRTDLLVDSSKVQPMSPSQKWSLSGVNVGGYTAAEGFPSMQQLLAVSGAAPNTPISKAEMEMGAVSLLSTGLFSKVAISCSQAAPGSPPMFTPKKGASPAPATPSFSLSSGTVNGVAEGERGTLEAVLPLGVLQYNVTPRQLPAPSAISLSGDGADSEDLKALIPSALQRCKASTVQGLMWLRAQILAKGAAKAVKFSGVESGAVQAQLSSNPSGDLTGLEGSAVGGKGVGIENGYTVGSRPASSTATGRVALPGISVTGPRPDAASSVAPKTASPVAVSLAMALTKPYSESQAAAGRTLGVQPGAAWRVAMEAAADAGSKVILLGDRPTEVTRVRLAEGIYGAMVGRWAACVALIGLAAAGGASGALPDGTALPAVGVALAASAAVGALPLLSPLNEIKEFAGKSASELESIVEIKSPLSENLDTPVQVWGEDALLNWPGAVTPVITERDAYMMQVLTAAAQGAPATVPAFLRTEDGSFRYAAASRGPKGANLVAGGSTPSSYDLASSASTKRIVAVVGSAHVKGMIRAHKSGAAVDLNALVN